MTKKKRKLVRITITQGDIKPGVDFANIYGCPLFLATKRRFPGLESVGIHEIKLKESYGGSHLFYGLTRPFLLEDFNRVKRTGRPFVTHVILESEPGGRVS